MNLLDIDLNDFVSKEIEKKISILEKDLASAREMISKQYSEITTLKKTVSVSETALDLLDHWQTEFSNIKRGDDDNGGWYDSKERNQYLFIEKIMLNIFNIKPEYNGWHSNRSNGSLAPYLAVNFYSNRETLIKLLMCIMKEDNTSSFSYGTRDVISFISSFVMPFDYSKSGVIDYVTDPKSNTNNCIFGISCYWVEGKAGKTNMPHDLIMRNPFILENDVFEQLLNTIKKRVPNYYYLFALPKYNKNISPEQIALLGESLLGVTTNVFTNIDVLEFISTNIKQFNNKTLDYLYELVISGHEKLKNFNWEKFPTEYQSKFLMAKPLNEVLTLLNNYNTKWTTEEKESFLKKYLNK